MVLCTVAMVSPMVSFDYVGVVVRLDWFAGEVEDADSGAYEFDADDVEIVLCRMPSDGATVFLAVEVAGFFDGVRFDELCGDFGDGCWGEAEAGDCARELAPLRVEVSHDAERLVSAIPACDAALMVGLPWLTPSLSLFSHP